jgi:hypothetical protein
MCLVLARSCPNPSHRASLWAIGSVWTFLTHWDMPTLTSAAYIAGASNGKLLAPTVAASSKVYLSRSKLKATRRDP